MFTHVQEGGAKGRKKAEGSSGDGPKAAAGGAMVRQYCPGDLYARVNIFLTCKHFLVFIRKYTDAYPCNLCVFMYVCTHQYLYLYTWIERPCVRGTYLLLVDTYNVGTYGHCVLISQKKENPAQGPGAAQRPQRCPAYWVKIPMRRQRCLTCARKQKKGALRPRVGSKLGPPLQGPAGR